MNYPHNSLEPNGAPNPVRSIIGSGPAMAEVFRITKQVGEREVELATLERGDFFGEMSLLESLPRDATARAIGQTELLVISAGALLVRMRRDPTFAFEMLHRLSGRVRALNARLVELIAKSGLDRAEIEQLLYLPTEERQHP